MTLRMRPARIEDAAVLAELVNAAGDGLPLYIWGRMTGPGESAWDVGRRRAMRDEGDFSWRNAVVLDDGSGAVGCLIGYPIPAAPEPPAEDTPALFVPLIELEALAPRTWYINVLAMLPGMRGQGHGAVLVDRAAAEAGALGLAALSLIVSDANAGARRFYTRHGFRDAAGRDMVKNGWETPGTRWILMVRDL
jgi:ribosomal protein S18 acetylase RimI-like enzyme